MKTEKLKQIEDIILTLKENNKKEKSRPKAHYDFENVDAIHDHYLLRLQELDEANTHLKKLVDLKTKDLNELRASNDKFVSIIAHDLRGPFSSILGSLEVLIEGLESYSVNEIRKLTNIASESAHKTLNLLDNLLMWALFHSKKRSINGVKVDLLTLLNGELETSIHSIEEKKIRVNNLIKSDLNVHVNLSIAKTIVRTLFTYVVKYTGKRGQIMLDAKDKNGYTEIIIKSNDSESLKTTGEKLLKIDELKSTTEIYNEKGAQLDLLLCQEFVELLGGYILIKSEIGIGCEITFAFPKYVNG